MGGGVWYNNGSNKNESSSRTSYKGQGGITHLASFFSLYIPNKEGKIMKMKDIELTENLEKIKKNTQGIEGSEWAINNIYAIIKQSEELEGKTPEEQKELAKVLSAAVAQQYEETIVNYLDLAKLVIVLLGGVDAITYAMLKQGKTGDVSETLRNLSDLIYNNLINAGLITSKEVSKLRADVAKNYNEMGDE